MVRVWTFGHPALRPEAARLVSDELLSALAEAYRAATPSTSRTAESNPSLSNGFSR